MSRVGECHSRTAALPRFDPSPESSFRPRGSHLLHSNGAGVGLASFKLRHGRAARNHRDEGGAKFSRVGECAGCCARRNSLFYLRWLCF